MIYFRIKQRDAGFTLIELVLYIGIVTILMGALIPFAWNIIEGGVKNTTYQEVFTQGQYVANRLTYEIRNASGINSVSPTQISLATATQATNPTIISLNSGIINLQQGSGTPVALNSANTAIQSLTFTNYSSSNNATENIQFDFTIIAHYQGAGTRQEYNASLSMEGDGEVRSN